MKKVFPIILSAALAVSSGCGGNNTEENINSSNNNSAAAASETVQTNSNVQNAQADVPVPEFTDANTALAEGDKYLDANATAKAVEAYKQAIKLSPDLADAHFKLGIAYSLVENEREAAQITGEETSPTPDKKSRKQKEKVTLTDSEKSFENAVKAYEKILDKDAKNDAAHFNQGRAYNKLNKDKEAEKALRQAVKLKPDDSEYQMEFGAILVKLANYDEAVPVLKKAVSLDENNSRAQELLEKAEAGKKRIDFGVKAVQQQMEAKQKSSGRAPSKEIKKEIEFEGDNPPPMPVAKPTGQ